MKLLRVAGATVNQTPMDWNGNEARLRTILSEARSLGVDVLCLPELCVSGYGCEDAFLSLNTSRMAEEVLETLLSETSGMTVLFGVSHYFMGALYNCGVMVQDGRPIGVNPKKVLPQEGIHYEPRWFRAWPFGRTAESRICGVDVPFGDLSYRLGDVRVAIEICEEAWGDQTGAALHARSGAEIVLAPSASHFALGKYEVRERLVSNNSRAMQVHYVYTNLVGNEAGRAIYDGGVMIAECGRIVARGPRFGFGDGTVTAVDLDLDLARVGKIRTKSLRSDEDEERLANLSAATVVKAKDPMTLSRSSGALSREHGQLFGSVAESDVRLGREQDFLEAQMLGLFDYLRKSRARGFVVSLSGGVDSSCVSVLVAQMTACALVEHGPERLADRLGLQALCPELTCETNPRKWVERLLTCVYQGTKNSGSETHKAAKSVAHALGARWFSVNVQPMVEGYVDLAEKTLGRKLSWENDDAALQNIQARARAPLGWLLANLGGAILLTTSNRSEGAVGYATMDGDTAGGLAPLAGIDKPFLRRWIAWAETRCERGLGAIPALALVRAMPPTAELRPPGMAQSDEGDLMPYDVLERIERLLVRDKAAPSDILSHLRREFPDAPSGQLTVWLRRFFHLWSISQWKRERTAVGFHLDDESLDPKTWCRFPVLNGGYVRELDQTTGPREK